MSNKELKKNKENFFISKKFLILLNVVLFATVLFFIFKDYNLSDVDRIIHDNDNPFKLTNPILDCELDNKENAVVFSSDLFDEVKDIKEKYNLDHVSLYYRDLNNGPWVGIHEKETFSPASLLKVPIAMALMHEAESDHGLLDKKIKIDESDVPNNFSQNILFPSSLSVGKEYTLREIMRDMITNSDNIAVVAMLREIKLESLSDVFKSIGVPYDGAEKEVPLRVKDYAAFFRVLFNSSYLNRENSEELLNILIKTEYKKGIVAGVPEGIVVAHKFGERNIEGEKNQKQLHDCGIIYYPNKPYILCVMTRGNDFEKLQSSIKDLSSFVYREVDKN